MWNEIFWLFIKCDQIMMCRRILLLSLLLLLDWLEDCWSLWDSHFLTLSLGFTLSFHFSGKGTAHSLCVSLSKAVMCTLALAPVRQEMPAFIYLDEEWTAINRATSSKTLGKERTAKRQFRLYLRSTDCWNVYSRKFTVDGELCWMWRSSNTMATLSAFSQLPNIH